MIFLARLVFWLGIAVVAYLTLAPTSDVVAVTPDVLLPSGEGINDKVEHIVFYGGLACLGCLGYSGRRNVILLLFGLITFGAGLEVAQIFVPGRSPGLDDVLANILGSVAGALIASKVHRRWFARAEAAASL